jgi:hypothetical protein
MKSTGPFEHVKVIQQYFAICLSFAMHDRVDQRGGLMDRNTHNEYMNGSKDKRQLIISGQEHVIILGQIQRS